MKKSRITHCKNCGAPALTEICHYCKQPSGLKDNSVELEYQVIECKEIVYTKYMYILTIVGALFIFFVGTDMAQKFDVNYVARGICLTMTLAILIMWILYKTKPLIKLDKLKSKGKKIEAKVCGYLNDSYEINGHLTQIVKLLVQTNDGPKYILYQTHETDKKYDVDSIVEMLVYKDEFHILKQK